MTMIKWPLHFVKMEGVVEDLVLLVCINCAAKDTATNSFSLVLNLSPLHVFLNNCNKKNQAFDVHSTGNHAPSYFILLLKEESDFFQGATLENRVSVLGIQKRTE